MNEGQFLMRNSVQFDAKQINQLEELEQLKLNLPQVSTRMRTHSTEQIQFHEARLRTRPSETQKSSGSVEKGLNLDQANQNVENLINAWKIQKNSQSFSQPTIEEEPEHRTSPVKPPPKILEVDEKDENPLLLKSHKIPNKYPNTTRAGAIQNKSLNISTPTVTSKKTTRPQTSKATPQPTKKVATQQQTNQANQIQKQQGILPKCQSEISFTQNSSYKRYVFENYRIRTQQQQHLQQQLSQKMPQRKQTIDAISLINQVSKMRDQVLKLYENQQFLHSTNVIATQIIQLLGFSNFEQIINTMNLDFK